jgi:hypothetical protein
MTAVAGTTGRPKTIIAGIAAAITVLATVVNPAAAVELSGYMGVEGRFFLHDPLFAGQRDQDGSLVFEPEFFRRFTDEISGSFIPFLRLDSADEERRHWDIRELQFWLVKEDWELRGGVGKVFWGATEFVHLVDVINQTDAVEDIDGEDKLGQPMLQLSLPREYGTFDFFVLPYFRERTFPGRKGRLRTAVEVDVDHPLFVSSAEQNHVDFALRYSASRWSSDFGLYYFQGTGREPTLLPAFNSSGQLRLIPLYEQVRQFGFDLQAAFGNIVWKFEALYRQGQGEGFAAATGGAEYTFYALGGSLADLGILLEFSFDDRQDRATIFAENDLMAGLRFSANDPAGSTALLGIIQDMDSSTKIIRLEASRRLSDAWKIILEGTFFADVEQDDILYDLRRDDFFRLELNYYF